MAAETLDVTSMVNSRFEPKRQTRWIFQIEGIDAYLLKKAQRPTFTTEPIEVPYINSRRWLAGTTKLSTIQMTLHDPIAPSGAQQVMEWLRVHFEIVSGRSGYADFYKRNAALKLLDPVGTVIEYWDLQGAMITESNFGELDYGNNGELMEIQLTIQCDSAVLQF